MDELEQSREVDRGLREILERRDAMLAGAPAISPARLASLRDVLAREFPVEAALSEVGARRDQLLEQHERTIPRRVEEALQRELTAIGQRHEAGRVSWSLEWRTCAFGWQRPWPWPARAAVVAAFLAVAAGLLPFGKWGSASRSRAEDENMKASLSDRLNSDPGLIQAAWSIGAERNPFNLRISAAELIAFRASSLAIDRTYSGDGTGEAAGMRLDLPVRPILFDGGIARMP